MQSKAAARAEAESPPVLHAARGVQGVHAVGDSAGHIGREEICAYQKNILRQFIKRNFLMIYQSLRKEMGKPRYLICLKAFMISQPKMRYLKLLKGA